MDMAYVLAALHALIDGNGKITATLKDMVVKDGPRPRAATDFGADISVLEAINARIPGKYNTIVRLGTGVAMTVSDVSGSLNPNKSDISRKSLNYYEHL